MSKNSGRVYLIGAGPGDAGLITVKGLTALQGADVIVYDRLANPALLAQRKPQANLIYVGKEPERHSLSQEEINRLLVKLAATGQIVARLKGGDPLVFGRGGEEAEALREAGLPYEIIPGITSAIAVPAYAGIPVTHRGLTSTFTVITGHEQPERINSGIDWARLAGDPGTLIFLMGVENLPVIAEKLQAGGKSGETPAAVIRWGTRPEQQVVQGTLADIVLRVKEAQLTSPAVIVLGEVVRLRDKLKWYEELPLFGQRIMVTRARPQASSLTSLLTELGGEVWEYPTIAIKPPEDWGPMDEALQSLEQYRWIFFTSVNGVEFFFQRWKEIGRDIRELPLARICAIGPATRQALEERGLQVCYMPEEYRAESLGEGLKEQLRPGEKALLPRADLARPYLADFLREQGLQVREVTAYRTVPEREDTELLTMLEQGEIHIITFTSSSTVRNFMHLLGDKEPKRLLQGVTIACIGPVTAETAREYGLEVAVTAKQYTIAGLVQALQDYQTERGVLT